MSELWQIMCVHVGKLFPYFKCGPSNSLIVVELDLMFLLSPEILMHHFKF